MNDLAVKIYKHLNQDKSLSELISGISLDWHNSLKRPYITITGGNSNFEYLNLYIFDVEINIWSTGPSKLESDTIAKKVINLLKHKRVETDDKKGRVFINNFGYINEDEPKNVRFNISLEVRVWNQFLI